jgi:hypothetical protein
MTAKFFVIQIIYRKENDFVCIKKNAFHSFYGVVCRFFFEEVNAISRFIISKLN